MCIVNDKLIPKITCVQSLLQTSVSHQSLEGILSFGGSLAVCTYREVKMNWGIILNPSSRETGDGNVREKGEAYKAMQEQYAKFSITKKNNIEV